MIDPTQRQELGTQPITRLQPNQLLQLKTKLPKKLLQFTSMIKRRLREDWDIVIGITGEEGVGKSELAIWLGLLIDKMFDLRKNISYLPTEKDVKQKFNKLKKYSVFDVDEAVKAFHKHKWYEKLQQTLIEMYTTERKQNKCTLVLMPRFRDFTENFRNHRIKIWINVLNRNVEKDRAIAVAYIRDDDKDIDDPWHFKKNIKMKEKKFGFQKITDRKVFQKLAIERKTLNYLFEFEYPPIPKELRNAYDKFMNEAKKVKIEVEDKNKSKRAERWKNALIKTLNYIKKVSSEPLSQHELAGISGLKQQSISDLLRRKK